MWSRSRWLSIALITLSPVVAKAAAITWTFQNVTFGNSSTATLSGSFKYDADTNTYSNINITIVAGSMGNGVQAGTYQFLDPGAVSSSVMLDVVTGTVGLGGTPVLFFSFPTPLTDDGGTVNLIPVVSESVICMASDCSTLQPPIVPILTGQVTAPLANPLTLGKSFGPANINVNGSTTLTFTVTNPNTGGPANGVMFTDILPTGLLVSTPVSTNCGGTVTAVAGSNSVSLSGATIAASASCTISVNVTATVAGSLVNTTSTITATNAPTGAAATATLTVTGDSFQVGYAANLGPTGGESFVDITNTGASSTTTTPQNLCINVYAFDAQEELLSCCFCQVTPNGLAALNVKQDLLSNTLTGASPTSAVIKLVATAPTTGVCDPTSAGTTANPLASGMAAWGTTLHHLPGSTTGFGLTERPFTISTLSAGELSHLTTFCAFDIANGTGAGICKGCTGHGGLGATSTQ